MAQLGGVEAWCGLVLKRRGQRRELERRRLFPKDMGDGDVWESKHVTVLGRPCSCARVGAVFVLRMWGYPRCEEFHPQRRRNPNTFVSPDGTHPALRPKKNQAAACDRLQTPLQTPHANVASVRLTALAVPEVRKSDGQPVPESNSGVLTRKEGRKEGRPRKGKACSSGLFFLPFIPKSSTCCF